MTDSCNDDRHRLFETPSHSQKKYNRRLRIFSQIEDDDIRQARSGTNLCKSAKSTVNHHPTAAITFSSIAIGVGNAVTSMVVGFGSTRDYDGLPISRAC